LIKESTEYASLPYQRGVRLGDVIRGACRSTYMAITVMPKPSFQIGDLKLSLEVGAYHWDEYKDVDLNTPERGFTTSEPDRIYQDVFGLSATYLKAVSMASATVAIYTTIM
jgi:hypothetical protein